jgi:hypothetical protein
MRSEFIGHHPPTADEIDKLWTSAVVVVDTNVLLSLYRLSFGAREKLLEILQESSGRIWIPHQVGYEFHENRVDRIREQQGMGKKVESALDSFKKSFASTLQEYSQNAFFEPRSLQAEWNEVVDDFKSRVRGTHFSKANEYAITPQNDPILIKLARLYEGKVGRKPSGEKLEELHGIASIRFEKNIPPGYKDAKNKPVPRCYGDYVLWWQVIEHAREKDVDILFVTDDKKSDWWWESDGEVLGPDPRLRKEFHDEAGKMFYAYRSNQFVRMFDERRSVPVDEAVVEEIRIVNDPPKKSLSGQRDAFAWVSEVFGSVRDANEHSARLSGKNAAQQDRLLELIENLRMIEGRAAQAQSLRDESVRVLATLQERLREANSNFEQAQVHGDVKLIASTQEVVNLLTERLGQAKVNLEHVTAVLDLHHYEMMKAQDRINALISSNSGD